MELPIFPLPLVMFPHVIVPLHIFEERYRLMINGCIEASEAFGIVFIPTGSEEGETTIRRVGVSAKVVQFDRLDDGRLNIMAAGEKRFHVRRFMGNAPFWKAEVEFFDDDPESGDELQETYDETVRLYREASQLAASIRGVELNEIRISESPELLSYMVSYVLGVEPEPKQELLEMKSTTGRLKALTVHLEDAVQRLKGQIARDKISEKVKGNGHLGLPGKKT